MAGLFDDLIEGTGSASGGSGLFDDLTPKKPGVLGTLKEGAKSTGRSLSAGIDAYRGDGDSIVRTAERQQQAPQNQSIADFSKSYYDRVEAAGDDPGVWDSIKSGVGAIAEQPKGAALSVVEQAPNAAVTLGGGWAGAKAGFALTPPVLPFVGPLAKPIGGAIGGLVGMLGGNVALETGQKAMEKADDGVVTPEEMSKARREGAVKGAVITAIDAATFKLGGAISSALLKPATVAAEAATRRTLVAQGVDVTSEAAVLAARKNPAVMKAVQEAQDLAIKSTQSVGARLAQGGALLSMETVGEGLGEYIGELAATGEASIPDAVLESFLSLGQSGAQTTWNMARSSARHLIQPLPTEDNPNPAPVDRPDPAAGALSRAAAQLPSPEPVLGLPAPDPVMYGGSDGVVQDIGPNVNVDGDVQPTPQARPAEIAGDRTMVGMEGQAPAGIQPNAIPAEEQRRIDRLAQPQIEQERADLIAAAHVNDVNSKIAEAMAERQALGEPEPNYPAPKGLELADKDGHGRWQADVYRESVQALVGQLAKGGDVAYVRDAHDRIIGRTPSINPSWWQNMDASVKPGSIEQANRIVSKALVGGNLGPKQARFIAGMMDLVDDLRTDPQRAAENHATLAALEQAASGEAARNQQDFEQGAERGRDVIEQDDAELHAYLTGQADPFRLSDLTPADYDAVYAEVIALDDTAEQTAEAAAIGDTETDLQGVAYGNNQGAGQAGSEVPAQQGVPGRGREAGQDGPAVPAGDAGLLESYSEEDLAERAQQQQQGERTEALAAQQEQADAERDDFTLAGSDRVADVAAAQGQSDLLSPPTQSERHADSEAFVSAPNGSLVFGEITSEMALAAGRQAGKIRLQQGVQNADGTGYGLTHIEANHGKQIRQAGYASVERFVRSALERPDTLWKPSATTQLVVIEQGRKGKAIFVQLQPAKDEEGDYYAVNTAFPVSGSYAQKKRGWKELWSRYPVPADASGASGFAGLTSQAGEAAPMVSPQSNDSIAQANPTSTAALIEDAGEKLGGARKDELRTVRERLDDMSDEAIASSKLSELWPKGEVDRITDPFHAAAYHAVRAHIPTKPRVAYRVKRWVDQVKAARGLLADLAGLGADASVARMREHSPSLNILANQIELYMGIDRAHWSRVSDAKIRNGRYSQDGEMVPGSWVELKVDKRGKSFYGHESIASALPAINQSLDSKPVAEKKQKFNIYTRTATGKVFISADADKERRALKSFESTGEARKYLDDHHGDLVAAWEAVKNRENVTKGDMRRSVNETRVGQDYRDGKDVTPEQFLDQFGFRGVEFGNWVKQGKGGRERQGILNDAYDAFMDLAGVIGVPPRALSLEGRLGVGFGSRGRGGSAAAHYEPGRMVINLTKTKGAGSLAHEWFHAADNYFSRKREAPVSSQGASTIDEAYITYRPEAMLVNKKHPAMRMTRAELSRYQANHPGAPLYAEDSWERDANHPKGVRPEVEKAFAELVATLNASPMLQRSKVIDGNRSDGYWSRIIERGARAFETYVIARLADQGARNDYLANVQTLEEFARDPGRYPYLTPDEQGPVNEAFDKLFSTIETQETDSGDVAMFRRTAGATAATLSRGDVEKIAAGLVTEAAMARRFVLTSWEQLPKAIKDTAAAQGARPGDIKAVHWRGKTYLVDRRFSDARDVERTIFHEYFAHYGLRQRYGKDLEKQMNRMLLRLGGVRGLQAMAESQGFNIDHYIEGAAQDASLTASQRGALLMDELLAHMAESTGTLKRFLQEWYGAVRNWLRENGYAELAKLNAADLSYELRMARQAAMEASEAEAGVPVFNRARDEGDVDAEVRALVEQYAGSEGAPTEAQILDAVKGYQDTEQDYGGRAAWEKARNTGHTKLNYRQWVLVRTPAFKQWFGEWENGRIETMDHGAAGRSSQAAASAAPEVAGRGENAGRDRRVHDVLIDPDTGEPRVFYHGTSDDIGAFDLNHPNRKDAGWLGRGVYVASDSRLANSYANLKGGSAEPNVMPIFVRSMGGLHAFDLETKQKLSRASQQTIDEVTRRLVDSGRDGAYLEFRDGAVELATFSTENVKSAIGNIGTFDPNNPDIRFSRASRAADAVLNRVLRTQATATADAFNDLSPMQQSLLRKVGTPPTVVQAKDWLKARMERAGTRIRQGIVDRYASLKELDEKLHGKDFIENSIHSSSWVLARMSSAASGAMQAMMSTGRLAFDKKEKVITLRDGKDTGGLTGLLAQLGSPAEVERWFGWVAANRAEKLMAEGRENLFTADEIRAGKTLNTGRTEAGDARPMLYGKVFREFQQYRDDVLGIAEQTGIISADNRAMWRDEFYVPFYRVMEEEVNGGPSTGKGLSRQEAFKKLKGGKQNLNDLLENTLMNFHHLLSASLKNQAAAQVMENAQAAGIAHRVPESGRDTKTSTFILKDGRKEFYQVDDGLVFEALTALADPGLNNLAVRTLSAFKRVFTNMTTVTPQFIIANTMRDLMQAAATSPTSKNVIANLVQGTRGYRDATTRAEMQASGGAFSFGHLYGADVNEVKASLQRTVKGAQLVTDPAMVPKLLTAAWRKWGDMADTAENISRTAIYQQNVEQRGRLRAAYEARDVMDFSQHGAFPAVRFLIRVVPFLNARLQGLDKLYRSGAKPALLTAMGKGTASDKQAAMRFGAVTGALTLASIALYLANADDDEFRKLEDWQKDAYWPIRIGDSFIFIPKPFEVGAIATMAERMTEQMVDDKATGKLFAARMKDMMLQTFSFSPVPQAFQPVLDVYSNKDAFTGRQIESMGMDRLSKGLRSRDNTTAAGHAVSAVSRALGDDSPIALSPVQADHLIRGYLGAVGANAAGIIDTVWRSANGEEAPDKRWSERQPFRRFYRDLDLPASHNRYSTLFYEGLREAGRVYADVKELQELGKTADARELQQDKRNILALRSTLNQQQRRVSAINKRMEAVRRSDRDGAWKRRELDRLTLMRSQIMERAGKRVESARASS